MFGEAGPTSTGFLGSFLKTLAFVMLCGIVGPLFLILYFVIDEDDIGWMFWTGLGITVLDVMIAFGIARSSARLQAKLARMQMSGHMALADITSLQQTTVEINDQPVMKSGCASTATTCRRSTSRSAKPCRSSRRRCCIAGSSRYSSTPTRANSKSTGRQPE